jgi:dolichol-phosphate mannosyltransferase
MTTTDSGESLLREMVRIRRVYDVQATLAGPIDLDTERRVSVFLPAFNEVDNLERAVADIVWAASQVLADYEILIIDDGSTDGTGELAERLGQENPRIRAIHQPRNMGIAAAYGRALDEAKLDHFSFLAADGEIARESVLDILGSIGRADIVAPYHQNPRARQLHRRFLTWGSTALVNVLFRQRMRYYQGPCIYPVALARALPKSAGGFYFLTQMLVHALHAGFTYVEVGLTHVDRTHGRSNAVSAKNILQALRAIAQAWWAIHLGGGSVARRI